MEIWLQTFAAVLVVSAVSLIGIFSFLISWDKFGKSIIFIVSLAAGTLLGDAFFHLIPEAFDNDSESASLFVLVGILLFFIVEKFIHWRHCHEAPSEHHPHTFSYVILIGDTVHNFIDGMVIAASFMIGWEVGVATTIAVVLHEIPQEIGDFGSLLYGGFTKKRAILYNFLTSLMSLAGAAFVLAYSGMGGEASQFMIPLAAGGFIYIAASDIIPELHKTTKKRESIFQLIFLLIGILIMYGLLFIE